MRLHRPLVENVAADQKLGCICSKLSQTKTMKTVSVEDLEVHFLDLVRLVEEKRETVLITRDGKPIAQIIPPTDDK